MHCLATLACTTAGAEGSTSPMHGVNTWPDAAQLPGWQQTVDTYFADMLKLSRVVAQALALSLGLPDDFFADKMQDPVAQLLLLRYPPPPSSNGMQPAANGQQEQAAVHGRADNAAKMQQQQQQQPQATDQKQHQYVGCGAHTDCGFLTILAQVCVTLTAGGLPAHKQTPGTIHQCSV